VTSGSPDLTNKIVSHVRCQIYKELLLVYQSETATGVTGFDSERLMTWSRVVQHGCSPFVQDALRFSLLLGLVKWYHHMHWIIISILACPLMVALRLLHFVCRVT
jgi:hypothetical protein